MQQMHHGPPHHGAPHHGELSHYGHHGEPSHYGYPPPMMHYVWGAPVASPPQSPHWSGHRGDLSAGEALYIYI